MGTNGVIDDVAENEIEAMNMAKTFLSFMPNSINSLPKKIKSNDNPSRSDNFLLNIVPKNNYEIETEIFKHCEHRIPTEGSSLGLQFIKKHFN